jgi:phosphoglycolate phosphatase-like HAD superfamily hydrolase
MLDRDKVQAILFDLDGTLMDTDDQAVEKLVHRLQRLRWPYPHRTARRLIMATETPANALMTLLDMVGLDAPLMAFTDWLRRWRGLCTRDDFRIVAAAQELLTTLNGRYRLAVVTTRSLAETEAFLDQHDLHGIFETLVTRESTWRLKPHPAPIRHAAQSLGVSVEQCVMVGDTTVDVKSARRAGAWAVAVLCGFGEREELERAGAHVILEHTAHLASWL